MSKRWIGPAMLVAAMWTIVVLPVRAQLASYVDEHGKLVYTNGNTNPRSTGSTINSRAAAAHLATAPEPPTRLERIVHEVAEKHSIDPALVKAVISTESGWNPFAISSKGAIGLMQLVPGTAQRFGIGNLFDPAQNVEAGTTYLKSLLERYNGDLEKSLAAYNAGERAVDRSGGVPRIWETQKYVRKVTDAYFRPGSGRDPSAWDPKHTSVRREVDSKGRVIYTNE
jgi:soluble lytic murein transglycosylase-like protein